MNSKYDTMKFILEKYKDTIDINYLTPDNISALHVLCFFIRNCTFINKGDQMLLFMENLNVNVKEKKESYIPIQIAAYYKNYSMVYELLRFPEIDFTILDDKKNTILQLMFLNAKNFEYRMIDKDELLDIIKLLIERKVNIMEVNSSVFLGFKIDL